MIRNGYVYTGLVQVGIRGVDGVLDRLSRGIYLGTRGKDERK